MIQIIATLLLCLVAQSAIAELPLGTVLITRNLNERDNTSPGYWNHLAIYVGDNVVIESQQGEGVIQTSLPAFLHRPYQAGVLYPRNELVGQRAAEIARRFVGRPYGQYSSVLPLVIRPLRMNCVTVVREAYELALGQPILGLQIPDDVLLFPSLFTNRAPR